MTDPEDADYRCTLTEFSLKKAQKELNEDPKERLGAVQTLRKWIRDQPHFTCRTDTKFLMAVLRRAKFSQLVARELIHNILTARTNHPEYMVNIDLQDPNILSFVDKGLLIHLPKVDKEGKKILLLRRGLRSANDPKMSPINEVRCSLGLFEMYRDEDENHSVNGIVLVFDCTGLSIQHLNEGGIDHNKKMSRIYQDCNPERVKAFHFYNAGPILEFLMGFIKTFLKKKNQERIQTHDTMESLYKVIPMELWPDEYLPDDYKGPSVGPIATITANMKKRMMDPEARNKVLAFTSDRYRIDETKRPSGGDIPNESFRKLNVD